jgi:cell volume regulation protein A
MELGSITAFIAIAAAIFIGFFGNAIFIRYRIPDVLILVALGVIIGPGILGEKFNLVTADALTGVEQYRDFFLSAALVLILFDGGLSLDLRSVVDSMRLATFITILTLLSEIVLVALAFHFFLGVDILLAVVFGTIVGGTSEAVVIPIANKMRIKKETKAMLVMESVITDVLVIVIAITLMSLMVIGDFSGTSVARELAVKFLVGGAVGLVAGVAWLFVLQRLQNQPLSYMITVAALFLVAGAVELPPINSSAAMAALTFGLSIGNKGYVRRWLSSIQLTLSSDEHIHEFHTEITFFVRTFFYVYLGLLVSATVFTLEHLLIGIGIIAIIVVVRRATSMVAWKIGDLDRADADALFSMMPRGLAAAVLATLPATMLGGTPPVFGGWEEAYKDLILNVALIVIVGTTALTTILSFWTEKNISKRNRMQLRQRLNGAPSVNRHDE